MVNLKTAAEIEKMREGGRRLSKVIADLRKILRPGVTTNEIDMAAYDLIKKQGGKSSFQTVSGYKWSTCLPINEQIVHTPPSSRKLEEGDVLTLDIGMLFEGFHTDYADSVIIGNGNYPEKKKFLEVGKDALSSAIRKALPGNRIGDISETIEKIVTGANYHIAHELTGHGIGRKLHEPPYVPGFLDRPKEKTQTLEKGLTIAIEVIYSVGSNDISYEKGDNWSIVSADYSLAACFEHTVVLTERGAEVLV